MLRGMEEYLKIFFFNLRFFIIVVQYMRNCYKVVYVVIVEVVGMIFKYFVEKDRQIEGIFYDYVVNFMNFFQQSNLGNFLFCIYRMYFYYLLKVDR